MCDNVNCLKCKTGYSCIQTGKCERIPINDIIRLFPKWFDKDNIRFFKSKWNNYAYQLGEYAYFISSEKHVNYYVGVNDPRKYTIRKFNMNTGDFSTDNKDIFNFQRYSTKKAAEKALNAYLKETL
jgi:hypothetical protein